MADWNWLSFPEFHPSNVKIFSKMQHFYFIAINVPGFLICFLYESFLISMLSLYVIIMWTSYTSGMLKKYTAAVVFRVCVLYPLLFLIWLLPCLFSQFFLSNLCLFSRHITVLDILQSGFSQLYLLSLFSSRVNFLLRVSEVAACMIRNKPVRQSWSG